MAHRIWRLLSSIKARDLTGLEIQKAASGTYMDQAAINDIAALRTVRSSIDVFTGPTAQGWADSHTNYQVTIPQNGDASVKPSSIFTGEDDAAGYVCQLMFASCQGATDAVSVTSYLKDDSSQVMVAGRVSGTTADQGFMLISNRPIYFTEDNYLLFDETQNASDAVLRLVVQIVSRGGNPQ